MSSIAVPEGVEAVILDMDGVVRQWRPDPRSALETSYGLPMGTIERVAFAVPECELGVLGLCRFADWLDAIARELSADLGTRALDVVTQWASYRGEIDQEMLAIVGQLRARVPVHVLSNAHDCFMDDMRQLGLAEAFDGFHYSAELRLAKPDPAAFLAVLERIGLPAQRCVFADDRPENVAAARSVGIHGLDFTTPAAFADSLAALRLESALQ